MAFSCKKCPYFGKVEQKIEKGSLVIGFCRLRQKHITDVSVNQSLCKDRAVLDL
jgi:hypothetical protein